MPPLVFTSPIVSRGPCIASSRPPKSWGGDLSLRIRLRKGDQLQELAAVANEALENLEQAFGEIRAREASSRGALRQVVDEMRVQPAADHGRLETLEKALKEGEQIDAVLQRFRFSDPR